MKFIIVILCALFIQGCDNVMLPVEYNKAEELCKKANQSVIAVSTDYILAPSYAHYMQVTCTEGVVVYSSVKR